MLTGCRQSSLIDIAPPSAVIIAFASSAKRLNTAGSGPLNSASIFEPPPGPNSNCHTLACAFG